MMSLLELIIFFSAAGELTMTFSFFGEFSNLDTALLVISIIYVFLPLQKINIYLFPDQDDFEVVIFLIFNSKG
jgi:hypothetical protein